VPFHVQITRGKNRHSFINSVIKSSIKLPNAIDKPHANLKQTLAWRHVIN